MAARKLGGEAAEQGDVQASSLTPTGGMTASNTPRNSHLKSAGEGADISEQSLADSRKDAHAGLKGAADVPPPVPAAPAVPTYPPAGDAVASSGANRAPVTLNQGHRAASGVGAFPAAQGAAAHAALGVGEIQGFAHAAFAQEGVDGANLAGANPTLVTSEVGATPVGFSEGAVKGGEASAVVRGGRAGETPTDEVEESPLSPVGLVLPSVGRSLLFEAGLMERLGRLVCEGALIEVVDVHKEDVMIRRALWMLSASLAHPSAAASLRVGQQPGLGETLSVEDQENLRSSGLSPDYPTRLRPTFETLEASLTEGRTLGLSRNKGKDKSKSKRGLGGHSGVGMAEPPLPSGGLTSPALVDTRPSSEPLGAGARVYGCLFDAVGDIIQAVVKAEAKPFREARLFLPTLRAATRWAAIEPSWGFARALASELLWLRETGERATTAEAAAAAPPPEALAPPPPAAAEATAPIASPPGTTSGPTAALTAAVPSSALEARDGCDRGSAHSLGHVQGGRGGACAVDAGGIAAERGPVGGKVGAPEEGAYCICRRGDDGGVMVSCDACSEWFHASCVGLTARVADGLEEYYCLVCCGSQPEKFGHYAHSWVTNVAVEAAVRRVAPKKTHAVSSAAKRKGKTAAAAKSSGEAETSALHGGKGSVRPSNSGEAREVARAECMATGAGTGGNPVAPGRSTHKRQRVASARLAEAVADAAETVPIPNVMPSKRLRDKARRGNDLPGAKRARATAWVSSYVQRHYAELGIRWPPERPSWREETRVDLDEPGVNDGDGLLDTSDPAASAEADADADAAATVAAAAALAAMGDVPPVWSASQTVGGESLVGASLDGYAIPVRPPSLAEILAGRPVEEKEVVRGHSSLQTSTTEERFVGQPGTAFGGCGEDSASSFAMMFKDVHGEPSSLEQQPQAAGCTPK